MYKVLQELWDKNRDKINDIYQDPDRSWWIHTEPGTCLECEGLHTGHEDTATELAKYFRRNNHPCKCDECQRLTAEKSNG